MKYLSDDIIPLRKNLLRILDPSGTYVTLVVGTERLLLVDTGFGLGDLRNLMETCFPIPYFVVNTHGHPNVVMGNREFLQVSVPQKDFSTVLYYSSTAYRKQQVIHFSQFLSPNEQQRYVSDDCCSYREYTAGDVFCLGDICAEAVPLAGHTVGSMGFLIKSERLLIAGDAFNPVLWMFTAESLPVTYLIESLEYALTLPFDSYIAGNSNAEISKDFLHTILYNARHLRRDESTRQKILGIDTYTSTYTDKNGVSKIIIPVKEDQATL